MREDPGVVKVACKCRKKEKMKSVKLYIFVGAFYIFEIFLRGSVSNLVNISRFELKNPLQLR